MRVANQEEIRHFPPGHKTYIEYEALNFIYKDYAQITVDVDLMTICGIKRYFKREVVLSTGLAIFKRPDFELTIYVNEQ